MISNDIVEKLVVLSGSLGAQRTELTELVSQLVESEDPDAGDAIQSLEAALTYLEDAIRSVDDAWM